MPGGPVVRLVVIVWPQEHDTIVEACQYEAVLARDTDRVDPSIAQVVESLPVQTRARWHAAV